ncbi:MULTISPECIES: DUF938 domain-containing protein [Pseudoalteromonas]|uniref:DUF938 domain-containing protein n=1 Tax=Pseudoalteromonas TaxID=53246 RepID=UPI0012310677|nr:MULTISPECIES: DUF938 domain-containing protein [Pseudoalteromonas]MBB1295398.1 DUF938 domain-containing protein [Pseudoalteromonas sp. SR41-4]MBB1303647.1 DUF938 domain-containing protein [Pseudoalteromonas sp. SR44-8]MBB1399796.1 DUF938 domain-containing protein [Pseudoalteromonas sp. SG44-8]MBB1411348.1 DUF938 domain-containing protein [Pseudoalteromonas sp. SG44-17]MBB1507716.1 DUF938 domain-containing protein [Pseudoalteromonas sp. SG41-1]
MTKPFSQACENNKNPILSVITAYLAQVESVLEVGSGTGQHSVHFAANLPHLQWHTSDRLVNHNGIKQWLDEAKLDNLHAPVELDLNRPWPINTVDAIYTANTLHIVSKPLVEQFFTGVNKHLASKGLVCIYGPFKYNGNFTSESNQRFDEFLNQQDCQSGIRDFEWVQQLAEQAGLMLVDDIAMPANNQLLIFKRH